jgi:hypothetical protein
MTVCDRESGWTAPPCPLGWYWGPQALVLTVLLLLRARPATVAGTALALSLFLFGFHAWVREALAWLFSCSPCRARWSVPSSRCS